MSRRSTVVSVRLPPDLAARASASAKAAGITLSEFVRRAAMGQTIPGSAPQLTFMAPHTYSASALEVIWEDRPANTTASWTPVSWAVSYT